MPDASLLQVAASPSPAATRPAAAGRHRRSPSARWLTAAQVLPVLAVVVVGLLHLHQAGDPQDEGALLVYADHVLHGAVAQRDFLTLYGPGLSWLLGGLFLMAGPSVIVERLLWLFLAAAIVVLVTRIARRWGPGQAAAAGALSAIWLVALPQSSSPWLAAAGLLLASLLVTTSVDGRAQRPWHFAVAGLLAGLALTFRLDLAPAVLLCPLPLLVARRHLWAWYVGGAVAGLIPLGVHVLVATPAVVLQNVFIDGVLVTGPGRRLPIPPTDPATLLALVAVTATALIAVAAAIVARRRDGGTTLTRLLAALAMLSVALLPEMFQRADSTHVYYAACVCVATLPVSLTVMLRGRLVHASRLLAPAVFVILIVATLLAPGRQGFAVTNMGREFFVTHAQVADARAVLADVDSIARPGWRVFVGPVDLRRTNYTATYLYFLLPQLDTTTYYLEMDPLIANRAGSRLASDVASANLLVLTTEWDGWAEPNRSMTLGSDAPNQVVSKLFCLQATDGVYRVYRRCAA